jgi:hypothetical protein
MIFMLGDVALHECLNINLTLACFQRQACLESTQIQVIGSIFNKTTYLSKYYFCGSSDKQQLPCNTRNHL